MTARDALDRAALTLGAVSVGSALFVFLRGDFQFVRMRGWGLAVALVLGLLAIAGGWLANRALVLAAGVGFLAAAAVLLALLSQGDGGFLDGNGSTFSLWLGLGAGLLALGLTSPMADSLTRRT
jgi:hypothetical protein